MDIWDFIRTRTDIRGYKTVVSRLKENLTYKQVLATFCSYVHWEIRVKMVGTKSMFEDLCLYCTILCQILQVHGNLVLKILYQRPRQNYQCLVQI